MELAMGDVDDLMRAATDGDVEHVSKLLDGGCDLLSRDMDGQTALFHAAAAGKVDVVRLLLARDGDRKLVNLARSDGGTPLFAACAGGFGDVLDALLSHGADGHARAQGGLTALHVVSMNGHANLVEPLLGCGICVDVTDDNVWTALHFASHFGHVDIVNKLLANGASVDHIDSLDQTAFFLATGAGQLDIVHVLLERDDGRKLVNLPRKKDKWTPLFAACAGGFGDVLDALLNHGADGHARAQGGLTALHVVSMNGHANLVEPLLGCGICVDVMDDDERTSLHYASANGHSDIVCILLAHKANPDVTHSSITKQATPLHLACYKGRADIVNTLLKHGVDVNRHTRINTGVSEEDIRWSSTTALHIACELGYTEIVNLLLNDGADPDDWNGHCLRPLHIASKKGHVDVVEALLSAGADVSATAEMYSESDHEYFSRLNDEGHGEFIPEQANWESWKTALHFASKHGHVNVIEVLLREGANTETGGWHPLHSACIGGHVEVVEFWLDRGLDVNNLRGRMYMSALHFASKHGRVNVVEYLIGRGADINTKTSENKTPLLLACEEGRTDAAKLLIDRDADPNISDKMEISPIFAASRGGHASIVDALIGHGADVNAMDELRKTALHYMCQGGNLSTVQLLLDAKLDPNAIDKYGDTPIHYASALGYTEVVETLLEHGATVDVADKDGNTPLGFASSEGHLKIVQVLSNAPVSQKDLKTALQLAGAEGHEDIVKFLLRSGVDGTETLYPLCRMGHVHLLKLLLKHGVDVNSQDESGKTALHWACWFPHFGNTFKVSLDWKFKDRDEGKIASLKLTSKRSTQDRMSVRVEVAKFLLENRANPNVQDETGRTPLHNACEWGDKAGVSMLLKPYTDISLEDKEGMTALHLAAKHHHNEIVSVLLSSNARVDARNHRGKTPLSECLNWGSNKSLRGVLETVYELMSRGAVYESSDEDYQLAPEIANIQHNRPFHVPSSTPVVLPNRSIRKCTPAWTHIEPSALAKVIPVCVSYWSSEQQSKKGHLTKVPPEILGLGPKNVQVYLRHIDTSNENNLILRRKVCVVGSSEAGKTSLVKSITKMTPNVANFSTIGVDLFDLRFSRDDETDGVVKKKNHEITFWDFAGQDVYHVAHTLFFSRHTLYLLCVDVEAFGVVVESARICTNEDDAEAMIDGFVRKHVWRWFRLIFSRQPEAEFVLIATKADATGASNVMISQMRLKNLEDKLFEILSDYQKSYKEEMDREIKSLSTSRMTDRSTNDQDTRIKDLTRLQAQLDKSLPSSWIAVSIVDVDSVESARSSIERVIMFSNRSFLMPVKYRRFLDRVKERRGQVRPLRNRVTHCFVPMSDLRDEMMQAESDLTEDDYVAILETLHVLGDVLWYARDGLQVLGDVVILDVELLIQLIREIVSHNPSQSQGSVSYSSVLLEDMRKHGKVAHEIVEKSNTWKHLGYPDQMLQLKELLQHFKLAYPADGLKMTATSHLIVPAYWHIRTNQVDLRCLEPLAKKFMCDGDSSSVTRYHWEYDFNYDSVETVFEQLVVRSYDLFEGHQINREIFGHCIESAAREDCAIRLALGTVGAHKQKRQVVVLEVVAVKRTIASELLRKMHAAVEDVLRGYPGLYVNRSAVVNGKRHRIDHSIESLRDRDPAESSELPPPYNWLPEGVETWFLGRNKSAKVAPPVPAMEKMTSMYNLQKSMAIKMEAGLEQIRTMHTALESKMDNTRKTMLNLHAGAGNHRDIPALWMVERVVKPKSKLILWILSEISGRCFHRPIEIDVSPRFLATHGEHLQTGLSVFANAVPDTIPLLGDIILGAVDVLKTKTEQAVRVHNMVDNLQLGDSGRLQSNENRKLPPATSYALLQSILREYDEQLSPHLISTHTSLECATLKDGSYQWAHREEHASRKNRFRIDYVKASVAQNPTTDTTTTTFEATSVSIVTQPTKFYLCDFVIRGLSSKTDGRLVYCSWELVDLKQSKSLDTGETIQNPHEDPQQQSLWLQAYPLTVDSVTQLRDCKLVVTMKRPSRLSLRSDRVVGSGSINLVDVVKTLTEQQFVSDRVEVPLPGLQTSIQCQLRTFGN